MPTTVKLEAWREIIVHDFTQLEPEEFFATILKTALGHGHDGPTVLPDIFWGSFNDRGYIWLRNLLDGSEVSAEECLKCRLHVTFLWFARFDIYQPAVRAVYERQEGIMRIVEADSIEARAIPGFLASIEEEAAV